LALTKIHGKTRPSLSVDSPLSDRPNAAPLHPDETVSVLSEIALVLSETFSVWSETFPVSSENVSVLSEKVPTSNRNFLVLSENDRP
jgi:hypothetical protein